MITYPPEMLPRPDEDAHVEIFVCAQTHEKPRLIASFSSAPRQKASAELALASDFNEAVDR
jgi:hypothetical protein